MGGKIDAYVDCASLYSYFALRYLRKNRNLLKQYGVEVEFIPFFLGGVNVATGNKPPASVPAKAAYAPYDTRRGVEYFGTESLTSPPFFPLFSIAPQRIMLVVKARHSQEKFETVFADTWAWVYNKHIDISKPEHLAELLSQHFDKAEVDKIFELYGTKEYKDLLTANTKYAIDKGAFGAPWFVMRNDQGVEEPIFGSDRWNYMFKFMGVDYTELAIVDKTAVRGAKL